MSAPPSFFPQASDHVHIVLRQIHAAPPNTIYIGSYRESACVYGSVGRARPLDPPLAALHSRGPRDHYRAGTLGASDATAPAPSSRSCRSHRAGIAPCVRASFRSSSIETARVHVHRITRDGDGVVAAPTAILQRQGLDSHYGANFIGTSHALRLHSSDGFATRLFEKYTCTLTIASRRMLFPARVPSRGNSCGNACLSTFIVDEQLRSQILGVPEEVADRAPRLGAEFFIA